MATYTSRLNLKKPAGNENINISDINSNMDKIDAETVIRNQETVWSTEKTITQFINECEAAMGSKKGIYFLGYINYSVVEPWGLDFNGYVVGLVHNESYKSIFIFASGNNARFGKIAKVNNVWDNRIHQNVDNRYVQGYVMNSYSIGYGFITDSGKTIRIIIPEAKMQTAQVVPELQTGCHFEIRGVNGYVTEFASGNNTEVVNNPSYTVSVSRINEGSGVIIVIQKTTAFGNIPNNTPISAIINPLIINFNAPT